ncbi:MAG: TIGR02996 domain-containing protein [Gemmataceae bacterium]|nr:TIGR02996 domain-containing protein [Gemmataceae bacterium]
MTTDHDALLAAVWAEPEDDGPRLVYADWLEENGQPERGEFIRVQCELARPGLTARRRLQLGAREQQLLTAHRAQWLGRLRRSPLPWVFHRGFVGRLGSRGVFQRGPDRWKDETFCHYVRFFPDGSVLCGYVSPAPQTLRAVEREVRAGREGVSRGTYTLAVESGQVVVRFKIVRGYPKGRYEGTIQGRFLRLQGHRSFCWPYRERYRWLSLEHVRPEAKGKGER